jgi:hypothetical protein
VAKEISVDGDVSAVASLWVDDDVADVSRFSAAVAEFPSTERFMVDDDVADVSRFSAVIDFVVLPPSSPLMVDVFDVVDVSGVSAVVVDVSGVSAVVVDVSGVSAVVVDVSGVSAVVVDFVVSRFSAAVVVFAVVSSSSSSSRPLVVEDAVDVAVDVSRFSAAVFVVVDFVVCLWSLERLVSEVGMLVLLFFFYRFATIVFFFLLLYNSYNLYNWYNENVCFVFGSFRMDNETEGP